jgi:ATP-binding cassette subfamily F protein 3
MLRVNNLKIEYSQLLFENVSFTLGNNERVALVGLNGCGKSTLLKIITGLEQPDTGSVNTVNEKIGYLPQEFNFNKNLLVGEYLESLVDNHFADMWKVNVILGKLNMKLINIENEVQGTDLQPLDFYAMFDQISEGQKLKLYLCKLMIDEATVLLLDEPTNHLDIDGINWLEKFLRGFDGIIIVISHDRLFLNNLIDKVYEIDENQLNIFEGDYDSYKEQKASWIEKRNQEFVLQEKKREKLEEKLELVRKLSDGKKRGAAVKAVKTRIKREVEENEKGRYSTKKLRNLNIEGAVHSKKTMIKIENLDFGYADKTVIKNSNLSLYGQDKAWFYGPNGVGKSTLIKLITGNLSPDKGSVKIGVNVNWAYFSQDQSHLPTDMTVRDYIMRYGKVDFHRSFGVLEKFLFPKELQNSTLGTLSPGQRARLSFAVFTMQENELLILDEPTNHLDIETKETIEESLYNYNGTILLISHDRYFVDQIGINRRFTIVDKQVVES